MQPGAREYDTVMETRRANVREALRILNRAGGQPPQSGDELLDSGSTMAFHEEIDQLIRNAIRKHLLWFTHKNQAIAEPHDYGIQNGIIRLFCYQVGGQSSDSFRDGVWWTSLRYTTAK